MLSGLVMITWAATALAQGPLTPPGGPAPTLKTLSQIEPRTDVLTLPPDANGGRTIGQPGSYYLTGNVTTGPIIIQASNVALDLSGFALQAPAGPASTGLMVLDGCKSCPHSQWEHRGLSGSVRFWGILRM